MGLKINIIGAGLGGIATACLLATEGHDVAVFEKNAQAGGKINEVKANGFRFDTGPSLLTMPFVLEDIFTRCGACLHDFLTIEPVDPICRYFYGDGTQLDCPSNIDERMKEIQRVAPEDIAHFQDYLQYTRDLYDRTKDAFLFNPLHSFSDLYALHFSDLLRIDAFRTMAYRIDDFFQSPYLRKLFKRFATYNGSSAFQAPATLNIISHVELALGGYYVCGGMYRIIEALMQLAQEKGVCFHFNTQVTQIEVHKNRAQSIITNDEVRHPADVIVANSDATETYRRLLPSAAISFRKKKTIAKVEPSCSGFVLLLGISQTYSQLRHHNIFFSDDYKYEFKQLFEQHVMPDDPTIYIADTSYHDPEHAIADGSNLFVLVNAPYLSKNWRWQAQTKPYAQQIIRQLERRGLTDLNQSIVYQKTITPLDFYRQYRSNKGSIYGTSSNSRWSAFLRPSNKARDIDGLYLAGGSTHPGGGIPLVLLSAQHAVELIDRYE